MAAYEEPQILGSHKHACVSVIKIVKNIRVKETKNCEKFPLFRAFKKQTKKRVTEMSETAIFFHAANFFAIIVNY